MNDISKGLYIAIVNFLKYEVNINLKTVIESPLEYPAVTICNLNPFDVAAETTTGDYIKTALRASQMSPSIVPLQNETAYYVVNLAAKILKATVVADQALSKESAKKLGFSIESMLVSCHYNGIECSSLNFTWYRTFEYGNCYIFNAAIDNSGNKIDSIKTSKAGPNSGLTLELFLGVPGMTIVLIIFYSNFLSKTINVLRTTRLLYYRTRTIRGSS